MIPKYRCPKCRDEYGQLVKRSVSQMVHGEMVEFLTDHWQVCSCVEQDRVNKLIRSSQMTDAFRKNTFETFDAQGVHETIREAYRKAFIYYKRFQDIRASNNNGICLLGRPGCGKTHLLMAITNKLFDDGIEVLYVPYVGVMEEVKNDMKKEDINAARFDKMMKVDVLFIDDLFKPPTVPSAYEVRKMFEVINYRYIERKPLLLSSELSIEDMLNIDEGLGSRIKEMCHDFRVIIKGGRELNYRLREDETA